MEVGVPALGNFACLADFRLNQPVVTVATSINDADLFGMAIEEHKEVMAQHIHLQGSFLRGHRLENMAFRPDYVYIVLTSGGVRLVLWGRRRLACDWRDGLGSIAAAPFDQLISIPTQLLFYSVQSPVKAGEDLRRTILATHQHAIGVGSNLNAEQMPLLRDNYSYIGYSVGILA